MMDKKEIKQLTFGVSFNHMFKLLDMWGEIADGILYKNKYFPESYFTNISTHYTTERNLINQEYGHTLVVTANNLVYTHIIVGEYEKEYEAFRKRVVNYIVPEILSKRGLVVRRLGMVYATEFDKDSISKFGAKYFNPTVQGITDFRFSKKEAVGKSLALSGTSDFVNKIFTVGTFAENVQGITYDYQLHFSPLREDVRGTIGGFLEAAGKDFISDIMGN